MEIILNNYYEDGKLKQSQGKVFKTKAPPANGAKFKNAVNRCREGRLKIWTGCGKKVQNLGKASEPLEVLRHSSIIRRVDVRLMRDLPCAKFILKAIDRIIKQGIFTDWLLLKCEATYIPFHLVHEEIEIYSTNSFQHLRQIIELESCLPLPFIYKDSDSNVKYFLLNFSESVNKKCDKLNSRVFFDVNNKEILVSLDVGIMLKGEYGTRVEHFKIYVEKQVENYVKQHLIEIKKLIVYNHVLWGYLQDWAKTTSYKMKIISKNQGGTKIVRNLTTKEIAMNLLLRKIDIKNIKQLNDLNCVFLIASFSDFALYLEFTPTRQSDYFSFTIDNIETPIMSTISVVQYYRQFFYINDESKSNALRCLLDYSQCKTNFLDLENVCEYQTGKEKPLLKTKTVEEINASVEVNKEQNSEDSIIKLLKGGVIDREKVKVKLLPFVKDCLKKCFENNFVEILNEDESKDTSLMVHRFQEAVARADRNGTFQAFLENVYMSLQMHFTNVTCQKIMECLIYKELENRYCNQDKDAEESVGVKELEELVGDKEESKGVKRKGETPEDSPGLKMPKLMPLSQFIRLERKNNDGLKYSCKLKSCSVVLNRMDMKKLQEMKVSSSNESTNGLNIVEENRLSESEISLNAPKEMEVDVSEAVPRDIVENQLNKESSLQANKESSLQANKESSLQAINESSPQANKENSPRANKEKGSETRDNGGGKNFMLKFPKIFLKSRSRTTSKSESETTHESDDDPPRKSQHFWDQEKLFRECLTTKPVVVLHRLEDVVGIKHINDKTVKITKNNKYEIKSEPLSPAKSPDSTGELEIKKEVITTEVKNVQSTKNDDINELKSKEEDLEIIKIVGNPVKPKVVSAKKKCGRCSKQFDTYNQVEEHEKSAHKNEKVFFCNYPNCEKRFHAMHYLELHKMTKHLKTLHCFYCKLTLKDADDLENHLMSYGHTHRRLNYVEVL